MKTIIALTLLSLLPLTARAAKDTPKERKRVHAHFAVLDTNKDSVIDDLELAAYAKKIHAGAVKSAKKGETVESEEEILADLKKEIAKADAKHDGKITEAEYDEYEEPLEK
jgi:hypothetical protein